MNKDLPTRRSNCSVSYALDYIGDKWTLLVLRDLLFNGKRHFRDFLASDENIASNILTQRLKQLVAAELVLRRPDPDSRRSVIYEPTAKAVDLIPVLLELIRWSGKYDPQFRMTAKLARRIEEDRDAVVAEVVARLGAKN
ncbi:winged helix-turn-helix transcriptional regulator [Nevskia soli]|uniref:winged helix-turn-helix transcriptional regulator n=1 Tax=Nevskia soli TaxID=418856 RepID=UPI00056A241B|nr:helix-turn-helix domain-containing protein [Nevskia soli]